MKNQLSQNLRQLLQTGQPTRSIITISMSSSPQATGRLDHDCQRPDHAEIQQLFGKIGLECMVWKLGSTR